MAESALLIPIAIRLQMMIVVPTRHAERIFIWTACIGGAVVLLSAAIIAFDISIPGGSYTSSSQGEFNKS
jgi:hypothetical protein